jgi:hypothetical protein
VSVTTLKTTYNAYFHSVIKCGIIFGGDSSKTVKIYILQKVKKGFRIMAGAQPRTSFRSLFKHLEILPVPFISLMNFILNNKEVFKQIFCP